MRSYLICLTVLLIAPCKGFAAWGWKENHPLPKCSDELTATPSMEEAAPLFPPIEPYLMGYLKVSALHEIYYEESGNPRGQPILFVHGGPGAGTIPEYRRFFDPSHYRIILFDQRGAGKSTPSAELRENTTWDLISDMEKLRIHLNIDKWILFGGSWGSTLSLVYAETHPEKVKGLILRGIFLCRKSEIDWFYQNGANHIFPAAWEKYVSHIPESERDNMVAAYYKRLTDPDPAVQLAAAKAWSIWEGSASHLYIPSNSKVETVYGEDSFALSFARMEAHYFYNSVFFPTDNYILENISKIQSIPTEIVHGQYDIVCPVENAWALKNELPAAHLEIVPDAGHSIDEPGITKKLIEITEKFKSL